MSSHPSFYQPAPVNQFVILNRDAQGRYFRTPRAWHNVVNGHEFDPENCMAAEGAVAIDAHTQGRITTGPAGIRNYQDDFDGGIGIDDVQTAWRRHFSAVLWTPDNFDWGDLIANVRNARRHAAVAVDYRRIPEAYQLEQPGNFDHALGIDAVRDSDGAVLLYDSLGTNPRWVPQSAVRPAVEAMAIRERASKSRLFVGFTASRPIIVKDPLFRVSVHPQKGTEGYPKRRTFGCYIVRDGVVRQALTLHTGGFSASADHADYYPWPGHSRLDLVHLRDGFLHDRYKGEAYIRQAYIVEDA